MKSSRLFKSQIKNVSNLRDAGEIIDDIGKHAFYTQWAYELVVDGIMVYVQLSITGKNSQEAQDFLEYMADELENEGFNVDVGTFNLKIKY